MKQDPNSGPTNIELHPTKFSGHTTWRPSIVHFYVTLPPALNAVTKLQ